MTYFAGNDAKQRNRTKIRLRFPDMGTCKEPGGQPQASRTGAVFPYEVNDTVQYTGLDSLCITCLATGEWAELHGCGDKEIAEGMYDLFFRLALSAWNSGIS